MKILAMVLAIVAALITAFDAVAVAAPRTTMLAGSVVFGQFTYVTRPTLLGFPDFTTVRAEWDGRGARLVIFARSRFRVSDFGANPCLWDGITESLERYQSRHQSRPTVDLLDVNTRDPAWPHKYTTIEWRSARHGDMTPNSELKNCQDFEWTLAMLIGIQNNNFQPAKTSDGLCRNS